MPLDGPCAGRDGTSPRAARMRPENGLSKSSVTRWPNGFDFSGAGIVTDLQSVYIYIYIIIYIIWRYVGAHCERFFRVC